MNYGDCIEVILLIWVCLNIAKYVGLASPKYVWLASLIYSVKNHRLLLSYYRSRRETNYAWLLAVCDFAIHVNYKQKSLQSRTHIYTCDINLCKQLDLLKILGTKLILLVAHLQRSHVIKLCRCQFVLKMRNIFR